MLPWKSKFKRQPIIRLIKVIRRDGRSCPVSRTPLEVRDSKGRSRRRRR